MNKPKLIEIHTTVVVPANILAVNQPQEMALVAYCDVGGFRKVVGWTGCGIAVCTEQHPDGEVFMATLSTSTKEIKECLEDMDFETSNLSDDFIGSCVEKIREAQRADLKAKIKKFQETGSLV